MALLVVLGWRERQAPQRATRPQARRTPCPAPVDWVGHGLLCLAAQDTSGRAVLAGLTSRGPRQPGYKPGPLAVQGLFRPLAPLRRLLAGSPVDLAQADEVALQALPEVGESLARSLVAAQRAGRLRCHGDLVTLPGLGRQRLLRLLRYVAPLQQDCPQSHPRK